LYISYYLPPDHFATHNSIVNGVLNPIEPFLINLTIPVKISIISGIININIPTHSINNIPENIDANINVIPINVIPAYFQSLSLIKCESIERININAIIIIPIALIASHGISL
jgi:hypothetical protein